MKSFQRILISLALGFIFTAGFGFFMIARAQSTDTISDAQINLIKTNCVSVKDTLNRIHASDALLRVNMGQIYESISTKLMDGFNGRVVGNNLNGIDLVSISSKYEQALDKFRSDYIGYEEKMSTAMSIDCNKQPVSFYDSIASARTHRKQVSDDVQELNQLIKNYKKAVDEIEKDFRLLNEKAS